MTAQQLYHTYLKQLGWQEKLELANLLMQSTLQVVRQETPEAPPSAEAQIMPEAGYTPMQQLLLQGPTMAQEDFEIYEEKKKHFAQWL